MNEATNNNSELDPPQQGGEQPTAIQDSEHSKESLAVRGLLRSLLRGIPTLVILGLLTVLALWGHHHDWQVPKFSELVGNQEIQGVLWCDDHGVPEADCISCNAELMPKKELYGWCAEHGVQECVLHHPQVAQLSADTVFDPTDFERAARALAVRGRTKNDSACNMHLRRIQFTSIAAVDLAGIDINLVDRGPVIETIKTTGEIVYDPTRVAHLSSRAKGTIWAVKKNVGDQVKQGDVLALVDAAEVGQLKSQLLKAKAQLDLNTKTFQRFSKLGGDIIPEQKIQEAKAAKSDAEFQLESTVQALANFGLLIDFDTIVGQPIIEVRANLRLLGIPQDVVESLDVSRTSTNLIPLVSPRDGVVVMRNAVAGEVVETGKSLFTVANTKQMWLLLNVRLEEAERITLGQKIVFRPSGSQREATGSVTWISTEVDSETRTVRVRGELANAQGRLRNETFGGGEIVLREEDDAIIVPSDSIHWEGCCHVAFVRDKDYFKEGSYKVFHTRSVRPGVKMGKNTEVIAGLLPGEVIVTAGSGILRAELLKGNLGAG
jgi:multidrug efflux pump subunit AcrA (membrane-fusion protein)